MVGKEIKKILVFGMPRSGTTVLQQQLAQLFELENLVEPELDNTPKSPYHWIANQHNCVIKFLSMTMVYRPWFKFKRFIDHGKFDLIVLTDRKDLTRGCVSCFYSQKIVKRFHYFLKDVYAAPTPFECDMNFVDDWIKSYNKYIEARHYLNKTNTPYTMVHYEDYTNNAEQEIAGIKFQLSSAGVASYDPKLDYSKLCTNYIEVQEQISKYINK